MIAVFAAFVMVPSTPANAASEDAICHLGEVCLWFGASYNGYLYDKYGDENCYYGQVVFPGSNPPYPVSNNTDSGYNANYTYYAKLFEHCEYMGPDTLRFRKYQQACAGSECYYSSNFPWAMSYEADAHYFTSSW